MRRVVYILMFLVAVIAVLTVPAIIVTAQETPEPTPQTTPEVTSETDALTPTIRPGDPAAYIRFGHFVPDEDAIDIHIDDVQSAVTGLEFTDMSDWSVITPGMHTISVVPAGGAEANAVIEAVELNLTNGDWITVLVVRDAEQDAPGLSLIREDPEVGLPGTANISFANALASGDAVNFLRDNVVFTTGASIITDGTVRTTSIPVDAGTYMYSATFSGTDQPVGADDLEVDAIDLSMHLIVLAGTADNPEIHVYETPRERILLLTGELEEPGTLIQAAQAHQHLSAFWQVVELAGLTEQLSGEGPYTVFAPADFVLDNLLTDFDGTREELETLVLNHVVEGNLKLTDLFETETVTTLAGNELSIVQQDQLFVNGIQLIDVNISATNGTIHIINNILMPEADG